jgi:hypothetical protein
MKINSIGAALVATLLLAAFPTACQKGDRDNTQARSDTAGSPTQESNPRVVPAPVDSGTGLSAPAEFPTTTLASDAQIIWHLSALCGTIGSQGSIARARAQDSAVKRLAEKLVGDYSPIVNRTEQVSLAAAVQPQQAPHDSLDERIRQSLEMLNAIPAPQFDAVYMRQQVNGQRAMLD